MRARTHTLLCCLALGGLFASPASLGEERALNPFVEAINLVAETQRAEIESADKGDWSLDTLKREWVVQRRVAPGIIDARNLFEVTYKIDGQRLLKWQVDLENKKVKTSHPPQ